jgi:hypothetical protein
MLYHLQVEADQHISANKNLRMAELDTLIHVLNVACGFIHTV